MKIYFIMFLFFPISSFGVGAKNEIKISDVKLSLVHCELIYEVNEIKKREKLVFPDSCKFHYNDSGEPRVEFVHGKYVVLIERSVPHPKRKTDSFFEGKCNTQILGVVIDNQKVYIRKNIVKVIGCSGLMWDRKLFSSFAKIL